jgi:hypothetical protein
MNRAADLLAQMKSFQQFTTDPSSTNSLGPELPPSIPTFPPKMVRPALHLRLKRPDDEISNPAK